MTTTTDTGERRDLADVFDSLLDADPSVCDRDGLAGLVAEALRVRGWLDAFDTKVARRSAALAREGRSEAPSNLLAGGGRRGRRDADAAAERGTVCEQMPSVADALENGNLSAGHVDAIAAAARGLDDSGKERLAECQDALVNAAAAMSPEEFDRECRNLAKSLSGDDGVSRQDSLRRQRNIRRWIDRHTGMHKTLISLDPLTDTTMWTAINNAVATARTAKQNDETTWDQLQCDTVVDMITSPHDGAGERVAEVLALIDLKSLLDGIAHDHTIAETSDGIPLPIATIRRLCCDASIIPVVLGANGEVLDVGQDQRLANRAQRRALRAMYRTCAHPGCTVSFEHCRIHHIIFFELDGPTNLDNLIPLCEQHHHLVHEGGWRLTLGANRRAVWTRPDGTLWTATAPNRTPTTITTPHPNDLARLADDLETMLREAATNRAPP